jgi:hypothetical protein
MMSQQVRGPDGWAGEREGRDGGAGGLWAAAVPGWEMWLMGHVIYHLALDNVLGALMNPTNVMSISR